MTLDQLKTFLAVQKLIFFFALCFCRPTISIRCTNTPIFLGYLSRIQKRLYLIMGLYKLMWVFFNLIPITSYGR